MGKESIAIIGRNGMGKTTLCNAIMGIEPPQASGSIRFQGEELLGKASHAVATQGHRLRPAGTPAVPVAERRRAHAHDPSGEGCRGRRTQLDRSTPSTTCFPRLAERKRNGGAQLSGGEQQMLAIGRALLTNPLLLIMDEPSEGLAPAIVENLIGVFRSLEEAGLAIILIEQNLAVATSRRPAAARDGRRPHLHRDDVRGARERPRGAASLPRGRAARRDRGLMATVVLLGTLDTKGLEYAFLRDRVREHGVDVLLHRRGDPRRAADDARHRARRDRGGRRRGASPALVAEGRSRCGDRRRWRVAPPRWSRACTRRAGSTASSGWAARATRRSSPRRCARCRSACRSCSSRRWPRATRGRTSVPSTSR